MLMVLIEAKWTKNRVFWTFPNLSVNNKKGVGSWLWSILV